MSDPEGQTSPSGDPFPLVDLPPFEDSPPVQVSLRSEPEPDERAQAHRELTGFVREAGRSEEPEEGDEA